MRTTSERVGRWVVLSGLAVVFVSAVTAAVGLYQHHRETSRSLWSSPGHDRNAHYRLGQQLAADVRAGRLDRFASDLEKGSIVWPPLHGLVLCGVILVGGRDPTLAVVPSLTGWVIGAVFAYLLANRAALRFGPVAGLVASGLVLATPTFRAYAADCMLESLGGGLTLAVLFTYLRWEQDRTRVAAVGFGATLSLLFFEKLNYWLLASLACGAVHLLSNRREWWGMTKKLWTDIHWRTWGMAQLRRPLNYPILVLVGLCVAVGLTGGFDVPFGGTTIELRGFGLLVTTAYALLLLRVTIWWWTGGRHTVRAWLGDFRQPLFYWFLAPVLVWFLIPLRITTFVWFLSPANTERVYHNSFGDTARFYWDGFVREYAGGSTVAWTLAGLAGVALLAAAWPGALRRGGWVVPLFTAMAVTLTLKHPNHKLRFLFTPAAGVWVSAGLGVAVVSDFLGRLTKPWGGVTTAVLMSVGLGLLVWVGMPGATVTSEKGYVAGSASLRDVTDAYLNELTESDRVAVFSNQPSKFWAAWSYLERFGQADRLQTDFREAGAVGPLSEDLYTRWLAATKCDALVFVEIPPGSPLDEPVPPFESNAPLRVWLPGQTTFALDHSISVPGVAGITIWRRQPVD